MYSNVVFKLLYLHIGKHLELILWAVHILNHQLDMGANTHSLHEMGSICSVLLIFPDTHPRTFCHLLKKSKPSPKIEVPLFNYTSTILPCIAAAQNYTNFIDLLLSTFRSNIQTFLICVRQILNWHFSFSSCFLFFSFFFAVGFIVMFWLVCISPEWSHVIFMKLSDKNSSCIGIMYANITLPIILWSSCPEPTPLLAKWCTWLG